MEKKRKDPRGRKPKSPDEKQGERITVNVTRAERRVLEAEVRKAGASSVSDFFMRPYRKGGR